MIELNPIISLAFSEFTPKYANIEGSKNTVAFKIIEEIKRKISIAVALKLLVSLICECAVNIISIILDSLSISWLLFSIRDLPICFAIALKIGPRQHF
ncbi:hypothetical protein SDC9_192390 [bioreactor metagenome]|uniref:Uncharacterized protein n=1 Tax=bioreactor metagenome TaxID=1076179 RepID=A0A645IBL5_9ZZZZ